MKTKLTMIVKSRDASAHPESFYRATCFIMFLGQLFGLIPIYGVCGKTCYHLSYSWNSFRVFYTAFNLAGSFFSATFCCIRFAVVGVMLDKTATLTFYICNFFGVLFFIRLARKWGGLVRKWSLMEECMHSYGFPKNIKVRLQLIALTVMFLALLEHMLFVLNALSLSWHCKVHSKRKWEVYFTFAFPQVFTMVSYSHWRAFLIETANILSTFTWNFIDLFVMIMSTAMAVRFKQISERIKTSKMVHEGFWRNVREDYDRLSNLCKMLDNTISPLVTVSYVNNLVFICIQLYNSFKPREGIISGLYFFYSFGFVLGRTVAVSIYAAWINEESTAPLKFLHSIPSEHYSGEVSRFITQIYSRPVGITGCRLFLINRSFLLRIAGTIVTIELMLLQFGPLLGDDRSFASARNVICV